jgi:hypothetical protein
MPQNALSFLAGPIVGWLVTVSLLVVAYLGALEVQERRKNRQMNRERSRLGLHRA